MTTILLLLFIASLVFAVERHHRRSQALPHPPHGADASIAFTDLDHDFDRVLHDVDAARAHLA